MQKPGYDPETRGYKSLIFPIKLFLLIMDLAGYAPTPAGFQPAASTKLALNPFLFKLLYQELNLNFSLMRGV